MDKENLARKSDHSKTTPRKLTPFTAEECEKIQNQLDRPIDNSDIQFRPAAQGTVAYLEGWKALNLANEVFGFNGWCSEILSLTTDFVDIVEGKVSLGVSCMLRVHLKDGTFHDDIGYGSSENQRSKGAAFEKARKEAVTDAMKRTLRIFGNRLGNCAYDKAYLKQVKSGNPQNPQSRQQPPPQPIMAKLPHPPQALRSLPTPTINIAPTTEPLKLSGLPPPPDYIPKWQHPKNIITSNNSEADSELVVTEEQLLEIGAHFDDVDELSQANRAAALRPKIHHHPTRGEFRNSPGILNLPHVEFSPATTMHCRPKT